MLSGLCTGCLYPQEIFLVLISGEAKLPQGLSAAKRIMSIKDSIDPIGNQIGNFLAFNTVSKFVYF